MIKNHTAYLKARVQALAKKDFKHNTILAPMEIEVHKRKFTIEEINRSDSGVGQKQKIQLFSIFDENRKVNCLCKFKAFPQMPKPTTNNPNPEATHVYQFHPKLAICICAYNQDKKMLQQSLKGIYSSLEKFERKAGIKSDQIVVIVIFDGIEKLCTGQGIDFSSDMLTFFDQVDYLNGSILREGEQSYQKIIRENKRIDEIDWSKTSSFTQQEIKQKTKNRFRNRYNEYMYKKRLLEYCRKKQRTYQVDKLKDEAPEVAEIFQKYKKEYIQEKIQERKIQRQYTEKELQTLQIKYAEQFIDSYKLRKQYLECSYQDMIKITENYFQSRAESSLLYTLEYRPHFNINNPEHHDTKYLNVLLCVKHSNGGKLSSHSLFFLGFCEFMQPELCMLLDIGLKPLGNSIYKIFQYMDKNPKTGGTCGYMGLKIQRAGDEFGIEEQLSHLDNTSNFIHESVFSIQKAQMFEYHFGHLIDKPFESFFNYIHVLPGAFSCYRYRCLEKKSLIQYLKPVLFPQQQRSLEQENRYLAEDRTLSLILKMQNFDFAYLPNAKAVVDPASNLITLLGQRRRWINGSWYAFFHVYDKRRQIKDLRVRFQFKYYYFTHGLTYISPSLFYISLRLTSGVLFQTIGQQLNISGNSLVYFETILTTLISFFYILIMGSLVFYSMNIKNNDKVFQKNYYFASTFLGFYGLLMVGFLIYNLIVLSFYGLNYQVMNISNPIVPPEVVRICMIGTVLMYSIQVLFSFKIQIILEILSCTIHYLFYAPTYIHILLIYAFAKIDDFSWGTKGRQSIQASTSENQNRITKYFHIYKFLAANFLVALILSIIIGYDFSRGIFILIFSIFFFCMTFFRFVTSIIYLLQYYYRSNYVYYNPNDIDKNLQRGNKIQQKLEDRLKILREIYFSDLNRIIQNQIKSQSYEEFEFRAELIQPQQIRNNLDESQALIDQRQFHKYN